MIIGAIAAGDERTADAGIQLLTGGGNAVDAAVAANLAAFVVEPVLTAPFGGGFAAVAGPGVQASVYDCFANVPGLGLESLGQPKDFRDTEVDFGATTQIFHVGRGAFACSSLLAGLLALHRDHGSRPLVEVAAPAVSLAQAGAPISNNIEGFICVLEPILRLAPDTEKLFAPQGPLLRTAEPFANPELVGLLTRVIHGQEPVDPPTMVKKFGPPHGHLTSQDLDHCRFFRRSPVRAPVGDCEVLLNPPPSSGGVLLAFALRLLADVPNDIWHNETEAALHLVAAMAICNQVRAETLDDALEASDNAIADHLLKPSSLQRWRTSFGETLQNGPTTGYKEPPSHGSTTHISVIDGNGLACSITSSNGEGCGHLVPDSGAMANNFMGEQDLHPRGFFSRPAGQRLTSMMCPTIVLREDRPMLVLGSGGSNRIRSALLQVIVHFFLRHRSIAEAVSAPRLHFENDTLYLEARSAGFELPNETVAALQDFVPNTVIFAHHNFFFGGVHAVDGQGNGAGDPRRGGVVRRL